MFSWPSSGKASCESSGQSSTGLVCAAGRTDMNIMDIQIQRSNPPPHNILPENRKNEENKITNAFSVKVLNKSSSIQSFQIFRQQSGKIKINVQILNLLYGLSWADLIPKYIYLSVYLYILQKSWFYVLHKLSFWSENLCVGFL